ncbi:MAG: uroporphyrinogen-III synthase [Candidatus Nitrotoga sp.]
MLKAKPLSGLKIVITRPREQADNLAQRITQAGGQAILFPLLEIHPAADTAALNQQLARLQEFNLAIFISPNAVRYGMDAILESVDNHATGANRGNRDAVQGERDAVWSFQTRSEQRRNAPDSPVSGGLPPDGAPAALSGLPRDRPLAAPSALHSPPSGEQRISPDNCQQTLITNDSSQILSKLKIAAMGPGSVQALREYGVHEVIAPQEKFDSETLLARPELQAVAGWKVMIFRGDGGRELLGETLKMRGAEVTYATCYQRSKPAVDMGKLLAARPDAVTVTSSEALHYFFELLDAQSKEIVFSTSLFVPHERIANAARKLGWQIVTLTQGGDEGLLSGLLAWANNR